MHFATKNKKNTSVLDRLLKPSVRTKLIIFVAGFNLLVAVTMSVVIYRITFNLFYKNFLNQKLTLAKTLARSIDGDIYKTFTGRNTIHNKDYQRYLKYLNSIKKEEPYITFLYTTTYQPDSDYLYYVIDADIANEDIIWLETQEFAFKILAKEKGKNNIISDKDSVTNDYKFKNQNINFNIKVQSDAILINDQKIAEIQNYNPLKIKITESECVIDTTNELCVANINYGNKNLETFLSVSYKGLSISEPGLRIQESEDFLSHIKKIYKNELDCIDTVTINSVYGKSINAYSPIKDSRNKVVGYVCVAVYEKELGFYKNSLANITLIIAIISSLVILLVLPVILELLILKNLRKLDQGIYQLTNNELDTQIKINSNDEFEHLATGFNYMAQNLKNYYDDLELKVRQRTEELQNAADEIKVQKDLLEIKNKDITASINYASIIQTSVLPGKETISTFLPEHFILFLPKDIVSGDFYFYKKVKHYLIIAVADCTGHGVPGAFMSMLGISLLNEIVRREEIQRTDAVLNELQKQLVGSLLSQNKKHSTRDGMDIALCVLNIENKSLQFSGANSKALIIRGSEIIHLNPDKMPIGLFDVENNGFTYEEMTICENDQIYLFTDGFLSQFGGAKGRKLLTKNFIKLIEESSLLEMNRQGEFLIEKLDEWRGDIKQVDDITVIGLKIGKKITNYKFDQKYVFSDKIILVAEDIDIYYRVIEIALQNTKAKVIRAYNGKEAVEWVKNNKADIILMDLEMPVMNGVMAIKLIRDFNSHIPIIVQTVTGTNEKVDAFNAGCNDYINKPIKDRELLSIIDKYLNQNTVLGH